MSDHRTYGETRDCKGCRYWSEMVAKAGGEHLTVVALCLSRDSDRKGTYQPGSARCTAWSSGHLGAIDEPGQEPDAYAREAA